MIQAHRHLSEQFADHSLDRAYLAVVWRVPPKRSGTVKELSAETPEPKKDGDCEPGWETCSDPFSATPKIR